MISFVPKPEWLEGIDGWEIKQMNDLVQRLHREARQDPEIQHTGHSILAEAAEEIERLRKWRMPLDHVEQFAIRCALGNNGGEWATHYTEDQKNFWRQFVKDLAVDLASHQ